MARAVLVVFSLVVVASALAVGPLSAETQDTRTEDSATVTVESAPTGSITLERGRFGSGRYHIDAPPVVVSLADVTGDPTIRYAIDIPGAWLTFTSRYDLAGRQGRLRMGASPDTVSPTRIEQDSYEATVVVWLRTDTRERALLQRGVTVEVKQ